MPSSDLRADLTIRSNVARYRLHNQRITQSTLEQPVDVVRWLGAVQAQSYLGALWAIGLRMRSATSHFVERAIVDRKIIRTWPVRGTLHFVAAADIRWMLKLLTPRAIAKSQLRVKQLELNDKVFARSQELFVKALEGGKQLPRDAMYKLLESAGITTSSGRGLHILGRLAQEGIICFGSRDGHHRHSLCWMSGLQATKARTAMSLLRNLRVATL